MSSHHSLIFIKNNDNTYEGIYCHRDGQVENGVGELLYNYYDNEIKVRSLIELGDASSLDEDISDSVFYCRDKQEDLHTYELDDEEDIISAATDLYISFIYMFQNETWEYAEYADNNELIWENLGDVF